MANFRLVNGMFVRVTKAHNGLAIGQRYQVLYTPGLAGRYFSLIGVNMRFAVKDGAKWLEPIPYEN